MLKYVRDLGNILEDVIRLALGFFDIIKAVSASGTTVLLVEQNAKKALSIADRAYVLETGKIILEGDAKVLMNDERVKKAYLGE